jgi:hypothetical protein
VLGTFRSVNCLFTGTLDGSTDFQPPLIKPSRDWPAVGLHEFLSIGHRIRGFPTSADFEWKISSQCSDVRGKKKEYLNSREVAFYLSNYLKAKTSVHITIHFVPHSEQEYIYICIFIYLFIK